MHARPLNTTASDAAFEEGAAAFRCGQQESQNPYPRGQSLGIAWRQGWQREYLIRNASGK
jgi:hypothetical protein